MYNVSENFNEDIHRFDRKINIKLSVNGEAIEKENLLKATIERAVTDGTSFTLGQTFSSKVVIELYKCDIEFKQGDRVDLSLLLEADKYQMEEPEEVPQGVYYIDKVEVNGVKVKLTAFDLFYTMEEEYSSTIEYPTTTKKLMAEITSKCGFKHDSTLEDITIVEKLEGYTAKELIGFIAGMQGKNAIINHKGEISFVDFTKVNYQLDPSSYITFTKENDYKITGVTCLFGDVGINSGDLTGNVLAFKNPWCKQSDVDRILKKYKGLTLTNANVRYIGNFGLLPSDIITLQDKEGTIHNLFISKHIISYSGGITGEIVSGCEDKADTSHYVNKIGNKKTLTELTIEQGKINAEIVDINKQANSTIEKVAQLEITAEGINQRVERAEQSVTTNSNNIASANGLISTLQTGLNTTNNNLSATNNTVSNLSSQVTTNKKNIASITTTVESITQQVGQTEEKIETIEGSISGINVNVSGMVEDITGLNNSLNTANTNISNAIKSLNTLKGEVDGVADDLGEFGDDLGALNGVVDGVIVDIEDIQGSVTSNSEKIATIKTDVDSITQTVTNTEKSVTSLSGKITTANNNISSLQSGLNTTNGNVSALNTTVTSINAQVESNKSQIASIKTDVNGITQTVSNTEKTVTTLSGTVTQTNKDLTSLGSKVDGIEVGGRNLILYSDLSKTLEDSAIKRRGTIHTISIDTTEKYENINSLKIVATASGNTSGEDVCIGTTLGNAENGVGTEKLVFSFYAKSTNSTSLKARLGYAGYNTNSTVKLTTTWKRYVIYITGDNARANGEIIFHLTGADTVYMSHLMMEKGTKASSWSLAPEDAIKEIGKVDVKVESNKTQLATLSTTLDSITQRVSSTESTTTTLNTTLTNTNKNLSTLQTNLGTANTNISNLQTGLNTANSNITTNKNNITTANNNITTNKNNIATNKNNITNLTTTVTNTNTKVATIETNLSGITSKVTGLETTTATISKNLTDLEIGGKNLLRNTALEGISFPHDEDGYNWRTASTGASVTGVTRTRVQITDCPAFPKGIYGIKFDNTTETSYAVDIAQDNITVEDGQEYTMSAYFKIVSGSPQYKLQYGTSPYPKKTQNTSTTWQRISFTFTYDKTKFENKLLTNIYFGIEGVKFSGYICGFRLEKGGKATDWQPAPEDTTGAIDNVYNHIDTQIIEVKNGYSSAIEILQGQINSTVEETTSIRDEITSLEGKWSTNINQTAKDITTTVTEQIKGVSDDLQEFENTVQTYMKFNSDGLELGKTGNRFKTKLTNTKLSFLDDSTEVAYISNKKMYITDAEVTNQLTIGKYAFVPRANGNTSLKWIG